MFHTIEELITDIRAGRMVILMDDEGRENEGDFVMAAEKVTTEHINFMTKYGRGLICMPMTKARIEQLGLPLMVPKREKIGTQFTVSIEAAEGVTTGISAEDRAITVQAAVKKDAKPSDLVQPGHIFPIIAQPGGVLTRAGHTEASTDLARLAGLEPAAVIVEILRDDGKMARQPDLLKIAKEHDIKIGTIADLIRYRIEHEATIECVSQFEVDTHFGSFQVKALLDKLDGEVHLSLQKGIINPDEPCWVRVHYQDDISDLLAVKGAEKSWTLHEAMAYMAKQEQGVVVLLTQPKSGRNLLSRLEEMASRQIESFDTDHFDHSIRMIGLGARILRALGVKKMHVLSPPKILPALSGFGLEVLDYKSQPSA